MIFELLIRFVACMCTLARFKTPMKNFYRLFGLELELAVILFLTVVVAIAALLLLV